jgi:hypothetical protein
MTVIAFHDARLKRLREQLAGRGYKLVMAQPRRGRHQRYLVQVLTAADGDGLMWINCHTLDDVERVLRGKTMAEQLGL